MAAIMAQAQSTCPNCGGSEIVHEDKSGNSICYDCGVVVEENAIVSSIEFSESGGNSQVIGQFVSATSSKAYSQSGRRGGFGGASRDSRENTLANGTQRLPAGAGVGGWEGGGCRRRPARLIHV